MHSLPITFVCTAFFFHLESPKKLSVCYWMCFFFAHSKRSLPMDRYVGLAGTMFPSISIINFFLFVVKNGAFNELFIISKLPLPRSFATYQYDSNIAYNPFFFVPSSSLLRIIVIKRSIWVSCCYIWTKMFGQPPLMFAR